jgi:TIR domain/Thioredoxin
MATFISHASDDGALIRSLGEDLEEAGKPVWPDRDPMGGEAWWTSILKHVRACQVCISAVSDYSLRPKSRRAELDYASVLGLSIRPALIGRVQSFHIKSVFTKQSIDYRKPMLTIPPALVGALDDGANHVPPISRVATNEDGFGFVVGADKASAKVDISIDPQCPGCRQFDAVLGGEVAHQVGESQLEVTYQPLILEDEIRHHDYSMHAAHAMFLAAGRNSGTSQKVISSFLHKIFAPDEELPEPAVSRTYRMVLSYRNGMSGCLVQSGERAWV